MDPMIAKLLDRLGAVTDSTTWTDQSIGEAETILLAAVDAAAAQRDVDGLERLAAGVEALRTEAARRLDEAEQTDEMIVSLLHRIAGVEDAAGDLEPVTAAAARQPTLPSIAELRARVPSDLMPNARAPQGPRVVTADGGHELSDRFELAAHVRDRLQHLARARSHSGVFNVAQIRFPASEVRTLDGDAHRNMEKINAVVSPTALVASGGICAPTEARYEIFNASIAERPIRDALPRFNASRGGIRFIEPSTVTSFSGAVEAITSAEDLAGETKNRLNVSCGTETEVEVQGVSLRERLGNFHAQFHPEQVAHNIDLGLARHARLAENELWAAMCADSCAVDVGENFGAWRDFLPGLATAGAQLRARHRMGAEQTLRLIAPFWLRDMIASDLNRNMPGDGTQSVTKAQIDAWLRNRSIVATWSLEGGTNLTGANNPEFPSQGCSSTTPLLGWPSVVEVLLFPEGSFIFLDGGVLDIGIVRDSTLNETNDAEFFYESFERVAFVGQESLCITMDLSANGLVAGEAADISCIAGS